MFVPIVAKDRLPVVGLELDHMGAGVKSHKLGQILDTELSLKNLLQYSLLGKLQTKIDLT